MIQKIKLELWRLKNRIKKFILTRPAIIDAGDLCKVKYKIYASKDGKLIFQTAAFTSEICGVKEYDRSDKIAFDVNPEKTLLDLLIKAPLDHAE